MNLTAEAVEGAALALERVDDIHGGDGLPAGVLGVGDRIADHVLEEHLEDTAGLLAARWEDERRKEGRNESVNTRRKRRREGTNECCLLYTSPSPRD